MKMKALLPMFVLASAGMNTIAIAETLTVEGDLDVSGQLTVGSSATTPVEGTIRYGDDGSGNNVFQGYSNSVWVPLTTELPDGFGPGTGLRSVVWGWGNTASEDCSTAWGKGNISSYSLATAWGENNFSTSAYTTAWGYGNVASGENATAWGEDNVASGSFSTVWGTLTNATGRSSTAWGIGTNAKAYLSTAFGRYNLGNFTFIDDANANNDGDRIWFVDDPILDIGIGTDSSNLANALTVLKNGKMALGSHTTLTGLQTQPETVQIEGPILVGDYQDVASVTATPGAIRYDATDNDFKGYDGSGWKSLTAVDASLPFVTSPTGGLSWGFQNTVSGERSTSWGETNVLTGHSSTAWGSDNTVDGEQATAWGTDNNASEYLTTTWGEGNTASIDIATAWGLGNNASGISSTAWGRSNTASGEVATTWGEDNIVSGEFSTAWGNGNNLSGSTSTAWGQSNIASEFITTAWGDNNVASGEMSTVWGAQNTAGGYNTTVWGESVITGTYGATAFGILNIGGGQDSDAFGSYQSYENEPVLEIGNGNSTSRRNAVTVLKDGRMLFGNHTEWAVSPVESVQIQGPLLIKDYDPSVDVNTQATPGAIRYDATENDFKGYDGSGWKSLTAVSASVPSLQEIFDNSSSNSAILDSDYEIIYNFTSGQTDFSTSMLMEPGFFSVFTGKKVAGVDENAQFTVADNNINLRFLSGDDEPEIEFRPDRSEFPHRVAYKADYTASYTDRSLVDKAYVDSKSSSVSRLTTQDGVTEVLSVDPTGVITLASAQGDIPMYVSP